MVNTYMSLNPTVSFNWMKTTLINITAPIYAVDKLKRYSLIVVVVVAAAAAAAAAVVVVVV